MTTLIIEVPDSEVDEISCIVKEKGGNVVNAEADNENLLPMELELLKRGLKEAILIQDYKIKSIVFGELWN